MGGASERVHATCVALGPWAALLRGASGAGKSDLALRFLSLSPLPAALGPAGLEAALVADDQVELTRRNQSILASAPGALAGRLEVRGVGIVDVTARSDASLALVVDLVPASRVDRMPDEEQTETILGIAVSRINLAPFEASAPLKLAVALNRAARKISASGTS